MKYDKADSKFETFQSIKFRHFNSRFAIPGHPQSIRYIFHWGGPAEQEIGLLSKAHSKPQ